MLSVIIAIVVVLADQISKHFVCLNLKQVGSIPIIEGILNFTYVENTGAAFGILSDNRAVFMVFSVMIIAVLAYVVVLFHGQSKLFDVCLGLIVGGGIGNMVDRAILGYVIDFLYFKKIANLLWQRKPLIKENWLIHLSSTIICETKGNIRTKGQGTYPLVVLKP